MRNAVLGGRNLRFVAAASAAVLALGVAPAVSSPIAGLSPVAQAQNANPTQAEIMNAARAEVQAAFAERKCVMPGEFALFSAQLDGDVPEASLALNEEDVVAFADTVGGTRLANDAATNTVGAELHVSPRVEGSDRPAPGNHDVRGTVTMGEETVDVVAKIYVPAEGEDCEGYDGGTGSLGGGSLGDLGGGEGSLGDLGGEAGAGSLAGLGLGLGSLTGSAGDDDGGDGGDGEGSGSLAELGIDIDLGSSAGDGEEGTGSLGDLNLGSIGGSIGDDDGDDDDDEDDGGDGGSGSLGDIDFGSIGGGDGEEGDGSVGDIDLGSLAGMLGSSGGSEGGSANLGSLILPIGIIAIGGLTLGSLLNADLGLALGSHQPAPQDPGNEAPGPDIDNGRG